MYEVLPAKNNSSCSFPVCGSSENIAMIYTSRLLSISRKASRMYSSLMLISVAKPKYLQQYVMSGLSLIKYAVIKMRNSGIISGIQQ